MLKNYFFNSMMHLGKVSMLVVLMGLSTEAFAQNASNYRFTQSVETYIPLTLADSILITSTSHNSIDDEIHTLPEGTIPFPFTIAGTSYTGLKIFQNGFVGFGPVGNKTASPISSSNGSEFILSPMAKDLVGMYRPDENILGNISYKTIGDAPNRKFVIQFNNFTPYNSATPTYTNNLFHLSFQIILNEDHTASFVYDISAIGAPSQQDFFVGIRGAVTSDFHTRTSTGTVQSNWNSSNKSISNSNKMVLNTSQSMPISGLTYNFLLPLPCEVPTAQPTNFVLTSNSVIINGTFEPASPAPDKYLVVRTLAGDTPNDPMDGVNYNVGANGYLNGYVVMHSGATSFTDNYSSGVRGNHTYDYRVYSVNSDCAGGPYYLALNPATNTVTNCPITMNGITVLGTTTDSILLNWPVGENGEANPMHRQVDVATDANFTTLVEGSPFMFYDNELQLEIYNLNPNTRYFFRGKNISTQCESDFSNVQSTYTQCISVDNFSENFDTAESAVMPNCWSKIITSVTSSNPTINVTSSYKNSAPYGVTFYGNGADMTNLDNKAILVSPSLLNVGEGTHRLRFQARLSSNGGTYDIQVVALSSNTPDAEIEVIGTISHTELTTTFKEFSVNFNDYTGSAAHVGIRRINGSSYSYLCIDDLSWEPIPNCPELSTLVVSQITPVGATISWDDAFGFPDLGYEYAVSNNASPSEDMTILATEDSQITISNLTDGTYYVFVRRVCSSEDVSTWKSVSFKTIASASAPWQEDFMTATSTTGTYGWDNTDVYISGNRAGVVGIGASEYVIFKNLNENKTLAKFSTITVGPIDAADYEFSFNYKQTAYQAPYEPLAAWGFITVEISTDFGATWTLLETITDQAPTINYVHKKYNLAAYEGQFVKFRITGNRTAGSFNLAFDVFKVAQAAAQTPCNSVTTFTETFEDFTYFPQNCWTASNPFGARIDTTIEGNQTLAIDLNANASENYIISPEVSTIDGLHHLSFDAIQVPEGVIFEIGTMTSPNNPDSFASFGDPFVLTAGTTFNSIAIPSIIDHKHIAINVMGISTQQTVILDNISWKVLNLSIEDFELNSIQIYPNPATTVLNLNSAIEIKSMEIYTITGQLVATSLTKQINVDHLQSGVYIIKVSAENGASKALKFVKK